MDMHLIRNAKEDGLYYLRGTVEHTGELNYGQYIDACRSSINGKWYMKTIRNFQIKHNSQVPNLIYYFIAEIL
jgi:hypothetical protein